MRTAIEDYEKTQVYGSQSAFWQHPIRDFFTPFWDSLKHNLGSDAIPERLKQQREIEEYFDILKYVKYTRISRAARVQGDYETAKEADEFRRQTLFGINPYTMNFTDLYRSIPRRERDYFEEFYKTTDLEERARIYTEVPENERNLYLARWKLTNAAQMQQALKKGLLTEEQAVSNRTVVG